MDDTSPVHVQLRLSETQGAEHLAPIQPARNPEYRDQSCETLTGGYDNTYVECIRDWRLCGNVPSVAELGLDVVRIHIVATSRWNPFQPNPGMIKWVNIVGPILRAFLDAGNPVLLGGPAN